MTILLLVGEAESGKSFMTKYILDNYVNYVEFALGDKLKHFTFEILKLCNIPINSLDELYNINTKNKYRHYLQKIGTECCRKIFGENIWCDTIAKDITKCIENEKNIIISDIRFMNEQQYFIRKYNNRNMKIYTIKVNRIDGYNSLSQQEREHQSEMEINNIKYDFVVNNDMTNNFYNNIDELMNSIHQLNLNNDIHNINENKHDNYNIDNLLLFDDINKTFNSNDTNVDINNIFNSNNTNYNINKTVDAKTMIAFNPMNNKKETINVSSKENQSSTSIIPRKTQNQSSYDIGTIGEQEVLEMIKSIRPKFETTLVSSTGHVADIHSVDHNHHIKYIFEIKHKQHITKDDVNKFKDDVTSMQQSETVNTIIGVFISLNSETIPLIGNISINKSTIYLTKKYFTVESLSILFKMIETYFICIDTKNKTEQKYDKVTYKIPENVLVLLVRLQAEYASLNKEKNILVAMKENTEQNANYIQNLLGNILLKQEFISFINNEFKDILPDAADSITMSEETRLRDYLRKTAKSNVKKRDLLNMFPTMKTKLSAMHLPDILKEYTNE